MKRETDACTSTNTIFSISLLVLIREDNGWLLTRTEFNAFKCALFAAKIPLLNLIRIFFEKLSLPF